MAKKDETAKDEKDLEADDETAESMEDEEADADDSPEESEDEASNTDNEIDYDAELDKENKNKADPKIAEQAFKGRKKKRTADGSADETEDTDAEEVDEDEQPLTRGEAKRLLASTEKKNLVVTALQIAKTLATSEKEALLIVAKWENRTFPTNVPLSEQIEEMYAVVHRKKLIGERNEALRGLKNKGRVNSDASGDRKDPKGDGSAPKIAPDMKVAITQSKLVLNKTTNRYERKLPNGDLLIYDVKTKSIVHQPRVA